MCEQKIFISYLFNSCVFVSKIKRDMENRQIFSETEKLFIVHKVAENKEILENKKKQIVARYVKNAVWEKICESFCSQSFTSKSTKQLKKCWDNIKRK